MYYLIDANNLTESIVIYSIVNGLMRCGAAFIGRQCGVHLRGVCDAECFLWMGKIQERNPIRIECGDSCRWFWLIFSKNHTIHIVIGCACSRSHQVPVTATPMRQRVAISRWDDEGQWKCLREKNAQCNSFRCERATVNKLRMPSRPNDYTHFDCSHTKWENNNVIRTHQIHSIRIKCWNKTTNENENECNAKHSDDEDDDNSHQSAQSSPASASPNSQSAKPAGRPAMGRTGKRMSPNRNV